MTMPIRVQRRRTKGWRMPPNTVYVGRPSKWANPFPDLRHRSLIRHSDRVKAIERFTAEILPTLDLTPLRGRNLACFCRLDQPCHADVLLREATTETP